MGGGAGPWRAVLAPLSAGVHHVRRLAWLNPRLVAALKTACAAGLAWLLVRPVGGFVHHYPYYAPLGAVVAMSTTVAGSVRYSVQAVCAIALGALLAAAARVASVDDIVAIALVIGVGILVGAWRRLGTMGSWVPTAGLFVLIVGGTDPLHYILAYGGLTAVGAVIGTAVNAVLPQMPLAPAARAEEALLREIARQLDDLADGLESEEPLTGEEWQTVCGKLDPHARNVEELVAVGMEARRGNWRASRWGDQVEHRRKRARALRSITGCVEEVVAVVSAPYVFLHEDDEDAARHRAGIAEALRAIAGMIRASTGEADAERESMAWKEADAAISRLESMVTEADPGASRRYLPAAAVVTGLRRAADAWR